MMKLSHVLTLLLCLGPFAATAGAVNEIRQETILLKQGSGTVKGRIKGRDAVDYLVKARSGQSLSVTFKPGNNSAYFNVLPPDSDEAIHIGSSSGNHFKTELSHGGTYTIRVYLMRNAARRNETAAYTLTTRLSDAVHTSNRSFDKYLELQGIRFRITAKQSGSSHLLLITPSGLEIDNSSIERTIEGTVTGAEVADINADGSPEIYVYITSAGSGSYGSLVAYSANRSKSLSEIYLPPLTDNKVLSKGYQGHDEFAVLEGVLGRRFPLYRDTDINTTPTGGMRQIQYKLVPGEAGWILKLDKMVEY